MQNFFSVNNLSKEYTDDSGFSIHLLDNISFKLEKNSITSILAPAGAGKSSLLRILCGLETATSGTIEINSPNRKVVYIPSKPSSFPWYSVKENLQLATMDQSKIKSIISAVGLEGYEDHYAHNDSIGFRLRIALGRALAASADVIVMDEPFSHKMKDATLERIYSLVFTLREKFQLTFLIGSSNLSESLLLSDKIYAMQKNPGKIVDSFDIKFDSVRKLDLINSEKFIDYRNKIENALKKSTSQSLSKIMV